MMANIHDYVCPGCGMEYTIFYATDSLPATKCEFCGVVHNPEKQPLSDKTITIINTTKAEILRTQNEA